MRKTRNPNKVLERLQEILWPLRLNQGLPMQDRHWKAAEALLRRGLVEPGPGAPVLNEAGKAALAGAS